MCISANYRLSPAATFPDHLIDVKKVIAWVREHGHEYGADPACVFVAGSSAGGHLAAMAALTPNDPAFQPGFERCRHLGHRRHLPLRLLRPARHRRAATLVTLAYVGPDAPPFFVAHGDQDTMVLVEGARLFVERLRSTSSSPVVYAELPGAQHAFDLFHSIRFETRRRCDRGVRRLGAVARWRDSAGPGTLSHQV